MSCNKIRPWLPGFDAGHLSFPDQRMVENHLSGCPDCQKGLTQTRKLRSLLAKKREDQPDEFFFRKFVDEFHHRMAAEVLQKATWWSRVRENLGLDGESHRIWIRAFSYGAAMVLVMILIGSPFFKTPELTVATRAPAISQVPSVEDGDSSFNRLVLARPPSPGQTVYVLDRIASQPSTHGACVIAF